jgi:aspartate-semialdehyde dehydrogenase
MRNYHIGVVGISGLVGQTFINIIEKENYPFFQWHFFSAHQHNLDKISFSNQQYNVELISEDKIKALDYLLLFTPEDVSKKYARLCEKNHVYAIDNSSYFRLKRGVCLIVPEVNISSYNKHYIISNPNCSTIQCVVPLHLIHQQFKLKKVYYHTYQSYSGKGKDGLKELDDKINKNDLNLIPCIGKVNLDYISSEEEKMVAETRKILQLPKLAVFACCVRIPSFYCHGVNVIFQCHKKISLNKIKEILKSQRIIKLIDEDYPLNLIHGTNEIYIMRIRKISNYELSFFTISDNLIKGSAYNAYQILHHLIGLNHQI